jgi:hypothetical protein
MQSFTIPQEEETQIDHIKGGNEGRIAREA